MTAPVIALLKSMQPDDCAYMEAIKRAGYVPLHEPMLHIEYNRMTLPDFCESAPLIFTSSHGVEAFVCNHKNRSNSVFTVGDDTAKTAEKAGFLNVCSAQGDVQALASLVRDACVNKTPVNLIYIRGREISYDLREILGKNDIKIHEIIGYEAKNAKNLSKNLLQALENHEIKAVLLFSMRGGGCFLNLVEQHGLTQRLKTVQALCIASSVVESVSVLPFEAFQIAKRPDRHGMMELINNISIA